jgi:hypothetical protein
MRDLLAGFFTIDGREGLSALPFQLLMCGFLIVALLAMVIASFCRRYVRALVPLVLLAGACILLQGGCWGGIHRATGHGSSDSSEFNIMLIALGVWVVWSLFLYCTRWR